MLSLVLGLMLIGMMGFVVATSEIQNPPTCEDSDDLDYSSVGEAFVNLSGAGTLTVSDGCLSDITSLLESDTSGIVQTLVDNMVAEGLITNDMITNDKILLEGICPTTLPDTLDNPLIFQTAYECPIGCSAGACSTILIDDSLPCPQYMLAECDGILVPQNETNENGCPLPPTCVEEEEDNETDGDTPISCPQYMPPAPGWCKGGAILPGVVKDSGCRGPQRCKIRNTIREAITEIRGDIREQKELRLEVRHDIRESLKEGEEINFSEARLMLKKINQEILALQMEKIRILTRLKLHNEGNASELKARLSNGRNATIKIMPNVASATALARLRLKVCNESRDCTIELKEVGNGTRARLVYEARARKTFKIWGFIKNHEEVRTRIDAETGEEIDVKRPWWAWMASESEEADENEE